MPRMVSVSVQITASFTMTVKLDDGSLEKMAKNLGCAVADLTLSDITEAAIDEAADMVPYDVCAQCSGWGRNWSLDLGEPDWEGAEVREIEG